MRTMLTLVVVLALAASAPAAMTLTWRSTVAAPGLLKTVGTLTTDAGKTIQAIDLGANGITPLRGDTFNQIGFFGGALPSVYEAMFGMPADPLDTHFLFALEEVVEVVAATESTSFIAGAINIRSEFQTQSVDFIQLVGTTEFAGMDGAVQLLYDFTAWDGTLHRFISPEPATGGLLVLGVLGLLRRR